MYVHIYVYVYIPLYIPWLVNIYICDMVICMCIYIIYVYVYIPLYIPWLVIYIYIYCLHRCVPFFLLYQHVISKIDPLLQPCRLDKHR